MINNFIKSKFKIVTIFIFLCFVILSGCNNTSIAVIDSPLITVDFLDKISQGEIEGASILHKFGAGEVGTSITPITISLEYKTPTTPQSLEFVSDSALDTFLGTGAREVQIKIINASWEEEVFIIETNGVTPVPLPKQVLRVTSWMVISSGTYATSTLGSHYGELTIREVGAGDIWTIIPNSPFPFGRSQIGVYTIPKGKSGWILSKTINTDSSKIIDVYLFERCNASDIAPPYTSAMTLLEREVGIQGGFDKTFRGGKGPFVGPCDIGFMGNVDVGSAIISIDYEMVLLDN